MVHTHYPSKSWVFERPFSFKVRQHGKKQLSLQYKVCWIFYKMVGAPYFSQTYLYILSTKSPLKVNSSISANFYIPISPLLVRKTIFAIPTNTRFVYTPAIFHFPIFTYSHPCSPYTKNIFPNSAMGSLDDWLCFNLSLLPWSMDRDKRAHNHWFLVAQAQKIDVLQVVVSHEDPCNQNGKPSNPPSLIPLTCCHHFHCLVVNTSTRTKICLETSCLT